MNNPTRKIKVLIVDDSMLYREVLSRGLSSDPGIEIIATAKDAFEARDRILSHRPDVMVCDVAMPKIDGIAFIRQLLPQYPLPVIVISTVSTAVFDAMNAGGGGLCCQARYECCKKCGDVYSGTHREDKDRFHGPGGVSSK